VKIWTLPAEEDWICDRLVDEWVADNPDITTLDRSKADILWLLSDWRWRSLPWDELVRKKVVTTVHHIVPEKFDSTERMLFEIRDRITDVYHVYNEHTYNFIRSNTMKPIKLIQYWANQNVYKSSGLSKLDIRRKHSLPENAFLIGSFQRDTEGCDLKSPKLEKGPDLLADAIKKYAARSEQPVEVVLGGWRRQYLMKRLDDMGICYHYFQRPPTKTLVELYESLDLYPVTARHEGGPQSLIECGLLNVPVVSRSVGIAEQVLPTSAINDDVTEAIPRVPNVETMKLPDGYKAYRNFFAGL